MLNSISDLPELTNENPPTTSSVGAKLRLASSYSHHQYELVERANAEPHNIDVEQGLLGAFLVNASAYDLVAGTLQADHFFDALHGEIYRVISALIVSGKTANPTTVRT